MTECIGTQNEWTEILPEIPIPSGFLIGSPSKFTNIYAPEPETILLRQEVLQPELAKVRVFKGTTKALKDYRPEGRRAAVRTLMESVGGGRVANLGSQIVYDARWVFNGNLSHMIGHHVANLGYIKSRLGIDGKQCLVILEKQSPDISHNVMRLVGYETFETNRPVNAQVVEVEINPMVSYHLIPFARELEPDTIIPGAYDKVFIPRSTSRRITNQNQIEPLIRERGYETVYFEDIPMEQQWGIIRDATSIVAIHGAALGYLPIRWNQTAPKHYDLLEIFSPGLVADCYRKTTAMVGGTWVGCRGHVSSDFVRVVEEGDNYKAMDAADFILPASALEKAFNTLSSIKARTP